MKKKRVKSRNTSSFSGLLGRIKPVSDAATVIAALFYGRAGTGKTTIAASFPGPVLHLDIREKGTDSIVDMDDVESLQLQSWDEFEQIYWYLVSPENRFKTVVVDAVSQLQDMAVEATQEENGSKGVMSQRLWGIAAGKLKTWLLNYRDLVDHNIHVVFLAHDRVHGGEEGEEGELTPTVGPRVMPSVASILTASVKMIGNTFIRETVTKGEGNKKIKTAEYCMRVGPHAYYETKVRQPKGSYLPDVIQDPDYEKLLMVMKGTYPRPEEKPEVKPNQPLRRRRK